MIVAIAVMIDASAEFGESARARFAGKVAA